MRKLSTKTNVNAPDSDYPYGRVRNNPGDHTGTPVDESLLGDIMQFFERMMFVSGVIANGLPDNNYSGFQLFQALGTYIITLVQTTANIVTTTSIANLAVTGAKIANGTIDSSKVDLTIFTGANAEVSDFDNILAGNIRTATGAASHAPSAGGTKIFQVVASKYLTNGSVLQVATQTEGVGVGNIYMRTSTLSVWTGWTLINNP